MRGRTTCAGKRTRSTFPAICRWRRESSSAKISREYYAGQTGRGEVAMSILTTPQDAPHFGRAFPLPLKRGEGQAEGWRRRVEHGSGQRGRGFSPSPQPSPLGRGRISRRACANPRRLDSSRRGMRCSLSLRERVRVRGNEAPPTKSAGRILQAQLDRLSEPVACATQKQISRHARRTTGVNREAELVFRALRPPYPPPPPPHRGE